MKTSRHPSGSLASVIGVTFILVFGAGAVAAGDRLMENAKSCDRLLSGHTDGVESVAFLPDGVRAVSGSRDKTLKLWNVQTGKLIRTFKGHEGAVFSIAVLPGGKQVASGSADHTVRIWDIESGDEVGQLDGHTGDVRGLAVLPGGKLVSGGGDGLRVWDVAHEKLIWKSGPDRNGVRAMSVSADGKRLAYTTMEDGTTRVWDLVARKEIADLDGTDRLADYAAITPDGKEVVCQHGTGHDIGRYNVDTRKQISLPASWELINGLIFTPDGKRAIFSRNFIEIWDWESGKELAALRVGTPMEVELTHCMALSPDGKTLLAGRGGMDDDGLWKPTRGNGIEVFTIPDSAAAPPQVASVGMLSWDVIPAKVKTLRGDVIPLEQWTWPVGEASPYAQASKMESLAKDLDVWWTAKSVMFHHGGGLLEEVLIDGTAGYTGVVWDGENAWVSSLKRSVLVLDRNGKIVDRGSDLPDCKYALKLFPLSPGKVLAAGTSVDDKGNPAHAWLAILQRQPTGGVVTKVFFKDSQLPREWEQDVNIQVAPSFRPNWFSEPPPAKPGGDHILWIGCTGVSGGVPVLQVNVNQLTAVPYNIRPAGAQRTPPMAGFGGGDVPPAWLSSDECVTVQDPKALSRCPVRAGYTPSADVKLLAETGWNFYNPTLLSTDGKLFLAGERWFRINPQSMEIVDMGPGVSNGGHVITSNIDYLVSAHFGLAAFSKTDNCFYRISIDPAHPATIRATEDPPADGKPVPPSGGVDEHDGTTQFVCGSVFYAFDNQTGVLLQQDWGVPWQRLASATDAESDRLARYYGRLERYPEERERVGITADQMKRLASISRGEGAVSRPPARPNKERLEAVFAAHHSATDDAGRDRAARLLLSMVRAASDQRATWRQEQVTRTKAVFTPRQLQLLAYQVVTEPK